jgi:hypothetical protein
MGCSQSLHVEQFTVRRLSAMELFAIPGGDATIFDSDVKFGISLGNPRAAPQQHSGKREGTKHGLIRSRSLVCHRQHL